MENKKYIYRPQNKAGKRVNNVYLKTLGKAIFSKTQSVLKEWITNIENEMSIVEKQ